LQKSSDNYIKEAALIEFEGAEQALRAKEKLNGIPYFGKNLSVNYSKYQSVSLT
jgi:RNA recognition motif-containing protein